MRTSPIILTLIFIFSSYYMTAQESNDSSALDTGKQGRIIYGFIRAGFYGDLGDNAGRSFLSSAYSDLGLKIETSNKRSARAFADVRFRYGSEFHDPVNSITIKEAFAEYTWKKWEISGGQKIIKWGRADFTNPTSRLNPQNYISRSPDREDMDMGNLLALIKWYPSDYITFEAVAVPYYKSSVLIIDPIPLPENVKVNEIQNLLTNDKKLSYALKADFHLRGIDFSTSWFDGYDPMPGIALTNFSLDLSGPLPVPSTELSATPYKTRVLGADFESSFGMFGIRGEGAWSVPYLSWKTHEFVPLPELKWVLGIDWTSGDWRIIGEYTGKSVRDYTPASAAPILAVQPDYAQLAQLLGQPGFDINEYVRQQVASFNRLYNYQLRRSYHSAGLKVETELLYGKVLPSVFALYNFTSRDLLLIPELRIKPVDGMTLVVGIEFYSGAKGSLYDIVNDFMNSVYAGIRIDF